MSVNAIAIALSVSMAASSTICLAAETITYVYDAKGRLTMVVRSGSVNNGIRTDYQHDKADNRTKVTTTGAPR